MVHRVSRLVRLRTGVVWRPRKFRFVELRSIHGVLSITFLFEVFVFINCSNSKCSVVLLRCALNPGAVCRHIINATNNDDDDDDDDDDGDVDVDEVDSPINSYSYMPVV